MKPQESINTTKNENISTTDFDEIVRLAKLSANNPKEPSTTDSIIHKYPEIYKRVYDIEIQRNKEKEKATIVENKSPIEGERIYLRNAQEGYLFKEKPEKDSFYVIFNIKGDKASYRLCGDEEAIIINYDAISDKKFDDNFTYSPKAKHIYNVKDGIVQKSEDGKMWQIVTEAEVVYTENTLKEFNEERINEVEEKFNEKINDIRKEIASDEVKNTNGEENTKMSFEQFEAKMKSGEIVVDSSKFIDIKLNIQEKLNKPLLKEREDLFKLLEETKKRDKKELIASVEFRNSLNLDSKKDENDLVEGMTLIEYITKMAGQEVDKEGRYQDIENRLKNIKLYSEEEIKKMAYIEYAKQYAGIEISDEQPNGEMQEPLEVIKENEEIVEEQKKELAKMHGDIPQAEETAKNLESDSEEENSGNNSENVNEKLLKGLDGLLDKYLEIQTTKEQTQKEIEILKSIQGNIKTTPEIDDNNLDNGKKEEQISISENIDDIVEILKNNKIDQIIVAGMYDKDKDIIRPIADLDTKVASYLLAYLNKNKVEDTFQEGAVTSFIGKGGEGKYETENIKGGKIYPLGFNFKDGKFKTSGEGKNLLESKVGVKVVIDTGGEWMKVIQNGEEKIIYIDHHGSGKKEPTSGTKMIYEIMKKAEMLDEKLWVKNLVDFVNDVDNLSYVNKVDKKGNRMFTENYFRNEWPATLYAFAENKIPTMDLVKLFESGIIKDYSKPFTKEDLNGKIGDFVVESLIGKDGIVIEKKLRDFINMESISKIREDIEENIEAVRAITQYNIKNQKLNLESKQFGKIMYQNFRSKYFEKNGKEFTLDKKGNRIMRNHLFNKWMGFKIIKSRGMDTMIFWDRKNKEFFVNSTKGDLVQLAKKLNEADPGCVKNGKDIRGVFIFGNIKNLKEKQFLDIIDPEIAKDAIIPSI